LLDGMTAAQPGRAAARLISMRAVKVVAAVAVICVAVLSGWLVGQRSPISVPMGASLQRLGGMPRFYLVVAGLEVVVRASADGHVTGTAAIPVPPASGRTSVDGEAFGSSDGLQFVIVVSRGGDLPGVAEVTLFRLTVSPDGRPGRLGQLAFDSTGEPVIGAALSPDDRMLALSLVHEFPAGPLYGSVEIIDLADGETRTWTGQSTPGDWAGVPAWASDDTVVVPWWHSISAGMSPIRPPGMIPAVITGIRQIDAAAPGGSLAAARLADFPAPVQGLQSAVITPGGEVIASSCRAAHNTATARIVELSAANGQLIRVLRTQTAQFSNAAYALGASFSTCQVLSVAGDGNQVLIQAIAFGRIDNGLFTALPGTPPGVAPVFAAW
jgi:hypothetical protein